MAPTVSTSLAEYDRTAEALRELARRDAELARHSRGSVKEHLVQVHEILLGWGQPEPVALAGLLHSAYAIEARGFCLFHWTERPRVSELLGHDVERLVLAFSGCEHDALISAAELTNDAVHLATRWEGIGVDLDRRDLARLMVIIAAHLAAEVCSPRGGPAPWLSVASRILAAVRANLDVPPPIFEESTFTMTADEEVSLLNAYRLLLRASVRGGHARGAVDSVLSSPVGEPLVLAALVLLADRRGAEAAALAERARKSFCACGVAWDKRLSFERWRQLADMVERDGRARDAEIDMVGWRAESILAAARGSPERMWALLDNRGAFRTVAPAPPKVAAVRAAQPEGGLPPRFVEYIGGLRHNADRPILHFYPGLRAIPWHDPKELAIVTDLERHAPEIAAEARSFDSFEVQDEAEEIPRQGRWSVAFLVEMGRRSSRNLDRSPVTCSVLEKHRTRMTDAGSVYFSCLSPKTRIAPHRGPTNVRVRCHLGLEVPTGCGLRVGGEVREWEEGRCIVFDDSFTHEAWNDSDRRRVVLILDLWHPDLSDDEIALLAGLQRYGRTSDLSLQQYWAQNEASRGRARAEPPAIPSADERPAKTKPSAAIDEAARSGFVEPPPGVLLWHSEQSLNAIGLATLGAMNRRKP